MTEKDTKNKQSEALWREAREAWQESAGGRALDAADAMTLAAYLDGRLEAEEAEAAEARLAADPALLEAVADLQGLVPAPVSAPVPESLIARAQGLVREQPKGEGPAKVGWIARWFPSGVMQPLGVAGAMAALVIVCGLSFELGRSGWAAIDEPGSGDSVAFSDPLGFSEDSLL